MTSIYLIPIIYVFGFFFITNVLKKALNIKMKKSEKRKSQELQIMETKLELLKNEQKNYFGKESFVKFTKLERQIQKTAKEIESILKTESILIDIKEDDLMGKIKTGIRKFIENSFLMSIITYLIFRNYKLTFNIDADIFFPLTSVLGFEKFGEVSLFSISFLFSYLNIRFCNKLAYLFNM